MNPVQQDYLAAEAHLVQVLQGVQGVKKVYSSADLTEVTNKTQATPCVHVSYLGDQVMDASQGGSQNHVKQTWLVVIAVRLGADSSKDAGQLISKTLKAIQEKNMVPQLGPLNRITSPAKPLLKAGFGYYPLAFSLAFKVK